MTIKRACPILALLVVISLLTRAIGRAAAVTLLSLLSGALVGELLDWCPRMADRLVEWAIRTQPPPDREVREEEWLGLLDETPGKVGRLIRATWIAICAPATSREARGLPPYQEAIPQAIWQALERWAAAGSLGLVLCTPVAKFLRHSMRVLERLPSIIQAGFGRTRWRIITAVTRLPKMADRLLKVAADLFRPLGRPRAVLTARRLGIGPGIPRRMLDLLVTGTAFVLLAPLFAIVTLAIVLTSPGPVFSRQVRVGQGGVPFTLLEFRTMRTGSSGPNVTTADDDRLTPVGRLLRLGGLDELPQLLNILRGEMTLVGPRPETPDLATRYPTGCDAVFRYRPGLTGPAAVRLRDRDELRSPYQDLEEYYLQVVVPTKVAVDLDFLQAPTLPRTAGAIVETLLYIVTGGRTHRAAPLGVVVEPQAIAPAEQSCSQDS